MAFTVPYRVTRAIASLVAEVENIAGKRIIPQALRNEHAALENTCPVQTPRTGTAWFSARLTGERVVYHEGVAHHSRVTPT